MNCGLYIHIPFCVKKCNYCDFLSGNANEETIKFYIEKLCEEIEEKSNIYMNRKIKTIYIGGGTPSYIEEKYISTIIERVYKNFDVDKNIEITIECNPGTVTIEKFREYKKVGINRISFGLQSTNNEELKQLGRIHTYEEFEKNYKMARKEGFENINIDLMSAIPNQTIESYKKSLEKLINLNPEHISSYSLIIEEGTAFYKNREKLILPNEDEERKMYTMTNEILEKAGYKRYEISNYSKEGYESKHNSSYWIGTEYIGVGLGASSYIEKMRFKNVDSMEEYLKKENWKLDDDIEKLTKQEQMEEFMFLGLRMIKGVSKKEFFKRFNVSMEEVYSEILKKYIKMEFLKEENNRIKLTNKGIDVSNSILSEFIL